MEVVCALEPLIKATPNVRTPLYKGRLSKPQEISVRLNKAFLKISLQKFGNYTYLKKLNFNLFNYEADKNAHFLCGYYSLGAPYILCPLLSPHIRYYVFVFHAAKFA